jgi:hypothetical protein
MPCCLLGISVEILSFWPNELPNICQQLFICEFK